MSKLGLNLVRWRFSANITAPSGGPEPSLQINGFSPVSTSPHFATDVDATYTSGPGTGDTWTLASQPATFSLVSGGTIAVPESGLVT